MKYVYAIFWIALLIFILGCGEKNPTNSPNGKTVSLEDFQPLKVGNWWKYERVDWDEWGSTEVDTFTLAIAQRDIVLEGKAGYLFVEDDNADLYWLVIVDDELRLYEDTPEDTLDYYVFLKQPIKVGTMWKHYSESVGDEYIWSQIVSTDETLHVPDAIYKNCVHVRTDFFSEGWYDAWYARDTGAIQWSVCDIDSTWGMIERLIDCSIQ